VKTLLIAPALGMAEADRAALQVQRSGNEVFPLTGCVSEEQVAEQCRAENGYECVVWLCHGSKEGLQLSPEFVLETEQVAAYMQGINGGLRIVLLAACDGQNTAAQIRIATGAAVLYSASALMTNRALTACATVLRALAVQGVAEGIRSAQTQGLRVYQGGTLQADTPHMGVGSEGSVTTLDDWGRLLQQELRAGAGRTDARMDALEARISAFETGLEQLSKRTRSDPSKAFQWSVGYALLVVSLLMLALSLHEASEFKMTDVVFLLAMLPTSGYLMMNGLGFFERRR
jgi:hypothetical protein